MRHPGVVVADLTRAIRTERGIPHAEVVANDLLDRDGTTSVLIGLATGALDAVYYHLRVQSIILVPFDALGLESFLSPRVCSLAITRHVESWIETQAPAGFSWLHPRFR